MSARGLHLLTSLVVAASASAASATNGPSPATTPPARLWGELRPLDIDLIAPERDQSGFNEFMSPPWSVARYVDIAAVDGRLVTADHWGLTVWSAAPGELPDHEGSIGYFSFPYRAIGEPSKWPIYDLAAAPAPHSIAALAGIGGMSLTLVDVTGAPVVLYQDGGDNGKTGHAVAVAYAGEEAYALLAADPGLHAYKLSAARAATGYVELAPDPNSQHPDVYRGVVAESPSLIRQIAVLDEHVLVANSLGQASLLAMTEVGPLTQLSAFSLSEPIYHLELWRHRGRAFAAVTVESGRLLLFDADPLLAGEASDLGSPLAAVAVSFGLGHAGRLVAADAEGIPALYLASGGEPTHDVSAAATPRDLLLDLRAPTAPRPVAEAAPGDPGYLAHALQFGWVRPLGAGFVGRTLHRAAGGVYDVHAWTPPDEPPAFVGAPPDTCHVGEVYQWTLVALDPEGALVEFSPGAAPAGLTVSPTGEVLWSCTQADIGVHMVAAIAFDGTLEAVAEWTIAVIDGEGSSGGSTSTTGDSSAGDEGTSSAGSEASASASASAGATGGQGGDPEACACRSSGPPPALLVVVLFAFARRRRPGPRSVAVGLGPAPSCGGAGHAVITSAASRRTRSRSARSVPAPP